MLHIFAGVADRLPGGIQRLQVLRTDIQKAHRKDPEGVPAHPQFLKSNTTTTQICHTALQHHKKTNNIAKKLGILVQTSVI